ncbi:MAG: Isoprenyl transferase [Candidatus Falkowbacteria bacterium GW2011_GWC2_38_22]|uniref:Isoprenyl transferase n=1 Tax=Candidatus Falkowbacteria bacterium GW2011_GWE1_38_31 TaxID=1618638 RepID=A0A0G0JPW7_9BACT|nr:MAG: Isoprenyl transferase [Candidatus Falkowbacteria bacterium GW2011_GWF2_38_1205]KKQ60535.1 MAG: Isoprenyl transferase [Candidatus Falkowbacteria bacterium GW2011_GWC2_38_22]KKQ62654.1 MAG: Isoprenyl transferase [Candidatus Falkowbacteria bacterium GW2011_GWF1_38_22]KKQ64714.1 MAG: Isoprenyl transferase [Candidatus Falkowbacteria bacterium GW2011_GWE2_38_254]KKQ69593.1 MAG: Isoprenyl transferase [Candidatus Falkowbacteria bacterium GW2011_GWE1_38_31]KKQ72030.1 MAG: Isoprenyl transferase 
METKKETLNIPKHVAIIMDGNRRWARERNLPTIEGHAKGYGKLKIIPDLFFQKGVEIISVYAFSTENWNRSQEEVNYLMQLMKQALSDELEEISKKEIKILISGRISDLPGDLPDLCLEAMEKSKNNNRGILNICLNYGGRAEIVDAIRSMLKNKVDLEQVHEGMVKKYLYQNDLPDPDIIVRTSGENRLSGFLLWQSAYSELLFVKKYWPDFEKIDVDFVLEEYALRKRRFGGGV